MSQWNDACPCIENDRPLSGVDFHTCGVATILDSSCPRRRVASTHSPKFHRQFIRHSTPPRFYSYLRFYYPHYQRLLKESFRHVSEKYFTRLGIDAPPINMNWEPSPV